METSGGGILGRLGEKVLGWIALGALIFVGIAIYQIPGATKAAIWSGVWRTIAWLVIVAIIPWGVRPFLSKLLEVGENWVGLALLAGLGALDVVVGLMIMTAWPAGLWSWLAVLGLLALVSTYNFLVMEYLSEMHGG